MDYVIPLIGEAWDHRRRRRRACLLAAAVLSLAAVLFFAMHTSPRAIRKPTVGLPIPRDTVRISPSTAFSQPPYMGVHCGAPNSIACDEVGLAVWLRRPAYSVDASIAGAALPLNWFGDQRRLGHPSTPRRAFDGYLRPAGIVSRLHVHPTGDIWDGDGTPFPIVWVLIDYGDGHFALTKLRVGLAAGWG